VLVIAVAVCGLSQAARISLSGYGTTVAGRAFAFSVIVNSDRAQAAAEPLDALIGAVAAYPGRTIRVA